ncbi:penicillin-insensitive murein endopeptidase [Pseudenhygromyxa sp. WMMC2535]|uniref:penicillin-insensitive murein endopeptidase n=1 Tax=Pseudenhygromyxa sp. WMMC2535 TaxID=2712867 RepID=UPI00155209B3|nr:penicillin-insensitive murein endopeptidase [Pseudenhygromyxa sp. WMMC2535]NVB42671.1 penicillin-insensitive murein endopeptidase [Pseudenhygromyxa sp. WMMC2535]
MSASALSPKSLGLLCAFFVALTPGSTKAAKPAAGAAEHDEAEHGETHDANESDESGDEVEGDPSEALDEKQAKKQPKSRAKKRSRAKEKKRRGDEACDFRTPIYEHVVTSGEHLGVIAGRYGVLSKDLIALNPKLAENPNLIRVGQKLAVCPEIPPREPFETQHLVAAGDTFNAIAQAHGLTPAELLEQQEGALRDPNRLRVGQKLRVVEAGEIVPGFEPEPPQPGRLVQGRKLPENDAYVIKRPHNAWGTPRAIQLIRQVIDRYSERELGGPKLRIGDISRRDGGPLAGHRSHQEGNDIDVGVILHGKLADRLHFSGATADNLDLERTWALIEEFLATGEVRYIFLDYAIQKQLYEHAKSQGMSERKLDEYFQYPRGIGRNHGIIRHWRGHVNHFHVRFRD